MQKALIFVLKLSLQLNRKLKLAKRLIIENLLLMSKVSQLVKIA